MYEDLVVEFIGLNNDSFFDALHFSIPFIVYFWNVYIYSLKNQQV